MGSGKAEADRRRGSLRCRRRSRSTRSTLAQLAWLLVCASAAHGVVIAGSDGALNTTPPSPDPGFANVGTIGALSGVYVGNGWVLTAEHVGERPIVLGGVSYEPVPGSRVRITNPDPPDADLIAFKLVRRPPLPDLDLPSGPVPIGATLTMIGNGRNRETDPTTWTGPGGTIFDGWSLASGNTLRWGTNRVDYTEQFILDTESFATTFDALAEPFAEDPEAQAVNGDSGGAAFRWNRGNAELVGILYARGSVNPEQANQPTSIVLYENLTFMVDLHHYREQIESLIGQPDCADGLDEDGDGAIDHPDDVGCSDPFDDSEWDAALVCDNGLDDDLDGLIDFPADPGCLDSLHATEVPEPSFGLGLALGTALLALGTRRRASS